MTKINIDANKPIGKIKPMHAVGQPPLAGINTGYFHYLTDAHIPYSRLHDVGGWFGGNMFVDTPNIFRDFDADVNDPASYDFTFTDLLIKGLADNHIEPYFRLGITIENYYLIKPYRSYPPKDFQKWAEICEHIIRHYNEGWADGFFYNIKYWEIWNEPEGHPNRIHMPMWHGTREQFFDLYRITSKHLRKCFGNSIKIGGYAMWGMYQGLGDEYIKSIEGWRERIDWLMEFFRLFTKMVKDENLPFDFFSHHSYKGAREMLLMEDFCEKELEKAGLDHVEIHLNEWNSQPGKYRAGTSFVCADAAAMLLAMQHTKMSMMCYYDARITGGDYGGLFNAYTRKPFCTYYAFKAFGELYDIGTEIKSETNSNDIFCVAAKDSNRGGIMLSNIGKADTVSLSVTKIKKAYLIDGDHMFTETEIDPENFILDENQVMYIEF